MNNKLFIFGLGYTANILAKELVTQGYTVIGTSRRGLIHFSDDDVSSTVLTDQDALSVDFYNQSIGTVKIINFDHDSIEKHICDATHILISIPPNITGNDVVLEDYQDLIINQAQQLKWLGYLSSTSVYGDYQGRWVNEESKCTPHTSTGLLRLNAEETWRLFAKKHKLPLHIFRLSGIYGPERNALAKILAGKKQSIYKQDQVFCRIHVADIVATLISSISYPTPLSVYNISDDEPAPAYQVDAFAAKLLGREPLELIPIEDAQLSRMESEFYANNRRVSNSKIKQELQIVLKYPSYKEGLTQLWRDYYAIK